MAKKTLLVILTVLMVTSLAVTSFAYGAWDEIEANIYKLNFEEGSLQTDSTRISGSKEAPFNGQVSAYINPYSAEALQYGREIAVQHFDGDPLRTIPAGEYTVTMWVLDKHDMIGDDSNDGEMALSMTFFTADQTGDLFHVVGGAVAGPEQNQKYNNPDTCVYHYTIFDFKNNKTNAKQVATKELENGTWEQWQFEIDLPVSCDKASFYFEQDAPASKHADHKLFFDEVVLVAKNPTETAEDIAEIKNALHIACVGDSITAEDYPLYLRQLLGKGYKVSNYGAHGAGAQNGPKVKWGPGNFSYFGASQYSASMKQKDLKYVIIMLGTNDAYSLDLAKPNTLDVYYDSLKKLCEGYASLESKPEILLVGSPYRNDIDARTVNLKNIVLPLQKRLAAEMGYRYLDMFALTEEQIVTNNNNILRDGVHFTAKGYKFLAEKMYEAFFKDGGNATVPKLEDSPAPETTEPAVDEPIPSADLIIADGQKITVSGIGGDCGTNGGKAGNEAIIELTFTSTVKGLDFTGLTADDLTVIASQRGLGQATDRDGKTGVTVKTADSSKLVLSTTYVDTGSAGFTWGGGFTNYVILQFTTKAGVECTFVVGAEYATGDLNLYWTTHTTDCGGSYGIASADYVSKVGSAAQETEVTTETSAPPAESESETETLSTQSTESETEKVTESESETEKATESEKVTETESETEKVTETEKATESETEKATEKETSAESEAPADDEESSGMTFVYIGIGVAVVAAAAVAGVFVMKSKKTKK